MGFLDKVKTQAEQMAKQGQDKLDEVQAKKKSDGLLRDLGAWHYAMDANRDEGAGPAEIARITGELNAHEAEHGPLGKKKNDDETEVIDAPVMPPPPMTAPVGDVPPPPSGAPSGDVPPPPPGTPSGTF